MNINKHHLGKYSVTIKHKGKKYANPIVSNKKMKLILSWPEKKAYMQMTVVSSQSMYNIFKDFDKHWLVVRNVFFTGQMEPSHVRHL